MVFATKKREPLLTKTIRQKVQNHIIENFRGKDIYLQGVNGHNDHIHCLISLAKEQSIAKVAQLIKGESSHWINQNNLFDGLLYWQDYYFAVSIGESQVEQVMRYIKNQEAHHANNFGEEEELFMRKYGWKKIKG